MVLKVGDLEAAEFFWPKVAVELRGHILDREAKGQALQFLVCSWFEKLFYKFWQLV